MPKKDSGFEDLFDKIRNAPEEEAREAFENMQQTLYRGAALGIIARNLSHGVGSHALAALISQKR